MTSSKSSVVRRIHYSTTRSSLVVQSLRWRSSIVSLRAAIALSLLMATPLIAQVEEERPRPSEPTPIVFASSDKPSPAPERKLRFATESQTLGSIPKFDGTGAGTVDSVIFEKSTNSNIGIRTTNPQAPLHLYAAPTFDMTIGIGPDPSGATGSALNIGYGGTTFGRGSGFLNVRPDALATGLNPSLHFLVGDIERMLITSNGSIAVGSTVQAKFTVGNGTDGGRAFYAFQRSNVESTVAGPGQNDTGFLAFAANDVATGATNPGTIVGGQAESWNFGPGTITTTIGGSYYSGVYHSQPSGTVANAIAIRAAVVDGNGGTVTNGYGVYITDSEATNDYGIYQAGANDTNYFAGNVIIGAPSTVAVPANNVLYVKGESYFDGTVSGRNIKAHYQDVAEWVPATSDLAPGTVVILNPARNNEVMASNVPYDTTVAGVVSARPGLSLGIEGEGKEQIATTGRVKVRVDAREHPIHIGDLMVTSNVSGAAMRSEPMDINGRKFHQPGTILGKALEPLAGGTGEILVLLSMQ
jgi:hypothetical protein